MEDLHEKKHGSPKVNLHKQYIDDKVVLMSYGDVPMGPTISVTLLASSITLIKYATRTQYPMHSTNGTLLPTPFGHQLGI